MDEENDKKSMGSNISAVFERIPILDGGGRRRLTAGTLVVLTAVLVIDSLRSGIATLITNKDLSLSLVLAGAGLLIYATGVIVELVGEVFLARAVSNFVWSYLHANAYAKTWRPLYRSIAWPYVSIWGTLRGACYFVLGLFGASRWRMRPMRRLSANASQAFENQPPAVRESIQCALGNNAEFGRKALIDQLRTPESRRWARTLMDRPKDVLALVSAIIISLSLYLALAPIPYSISPETNSALAQEQRVLSEAFRLVDTQFDAKEISEVKKREHTETDQAKVQDPVLQTRLLISNAVQAMRNFADLTDPSKLPAWDSSSHFGSTSIEVYLNTWTDDFIGACNGDGVPKDVKIEKDDYPDLKPLTKLLASVCDTFDARKAAGVIENAYQQVETSRDQERLRRAALLFAALFLYVAFFNTLTATTISVIELLAFQTLPQPITPADPT
jgi:hypothetical protein